MNLFWIVLETRDEKAEILKKVINALNIWPEEKDLYLISLGILNDQDFTVFFNTIMSQISNSNTEKSKKFFRIEPLTSQII